MSMGSLTMRLWKGPPAYLSLQANTSVPLVVPDRTDEHNIPSIPWCHSCETQGGHNLQGQQCTFPFCVVLDEQDT